jgi:GNAT superfamily N-acetyltransferase
VAEPAIQARDGLAGELEERLYEFNLVASGHADGEELGFVVEEDGQMVAGLSGYTWGGMADVKQLWVREDRRHAGLGSALMRSAIEEARARGCRLMFLTTHSFQAPGFYARLGFEELAVIADKPPGHAEHILRLTLS